MPPKPIADFQIASAQRYLLLSSIQANTLSVYYAKLDNLNYDESVDTVPTNSNSATEPIQ